MQGQKNFSWARSKPYVIALCVCVWVILISIALRKNPSTAETEEKLIIMKTDMSALMAQGGKVLKSKENAKYGSALVYRSLYDEGWSSELVSKYENTLLRKNWEKVSGTTRRFCKDGMLAEIISNSGTYNGQGTNLVSMLFDPTTIEKCAQRTSPRRSD